MIDERFVATSHRFDPPPDAFERLRRRRDRKRRNQRIAAGVVGIAVFVAAVWVVTSGGSLDRREKSVAPAGEVTGPAETAPPPPLALGAPDVVEQGRCDAGARLRLEITIGGCTHCVGLRFEVHRSPVGHEWRITLRKSRVGDPPQVFYRGTWVASDSGDLAVTQPNYNPALHYYRAKAVDTQTGQVCRVKVKSALL